MYDTELHTGLPHFAVNNVALGNYNYHPSDIRYVGVSIGGISTGGFYDAGNYISKDYEMTGKSQLWCKISNIEMTVDELLLNERLYDIASQDKKILPFINQYTKKIKLAHKTKKITLIYFVKHIVMQDIWRQKILKIKHLLILCLNKVKQHILEIG